MKHLIFTFIFATFFSYSQGPATTLNSPEDGSACVSRFVDFDWTDMPNSTDYRIQITTTDGDWVNTEVDQGLIQNSEYSSTLTSSSTYYWRVGTNYSNTLVYSNSNSFITSSAGPNGILPVDDDTCIDLDNVNFEWESVENAASYQLQVASSPAFFSFEYVDNNVSGTSTSTTLSGGDLTHYWRVRANYLANGQPCVSDWGPVQTFKTDPNSPVLSSPSNNSTGLDFSVDFNWSIVNNTVNYQLQVSESSTFGPGDLIYDNQGLVSNTETVALLANQYNKQYWWRTKAILADCESDWSEVFTLTTKLNQTNLLEPEDNENCVNLVDALFSWEDSQPGSNYQIQISTLTNFDDVSIDQIINGTSTLVELPSPNTTFLWRVRSNKGGNVSDWSDVRQFVSSNPIPVLDEPKDGDEDLFVEVTLDVDPLGSYTNLWLQVADGPEFDEEDIVFDLPNSSPTVTVVLDEYGQTYYWRASSTLGECESGWSESSSFTTYSGGVTSIEPAKDADNQTLDLVFRWEPVTFATGYEIHIAKSNAFDVIEKGRIVDAPSTDVFIPELDPNETYFWRVRSLNEYGAAPWSETNVFSTGEERASRPFLISPADTETLIALDHDFQWTETPNTDSYELEISKEDNFENVILNLSDLSSTTTKIDGLENYTYYFWRLRSVNQTSKSNWSNVFTFRTTAKLVVDSPILDEPDDESTNQDPTRLNFSWFSIDNVVEYDGLYQLQVATADDFEEESIVVNRRNFLETNSDIKDLPSSETLYWRVRGFNEAGDGPWSEIFSFETFDPLGINDFVNIRNIDISPNPNTGEFRLDYYLKTPGQVEILVFDMLGNKVFAQNNGCLPIGNQTQSLNLDLANGNYILLLKNGNSAVTYKFSIEK